MNRLPSSTIADMARRFYAHTTDEPKQAIVGQLGTNPLNHAEFMYRIMLGPLQRAPDITEVHEWLTYQDLASRTFARKNT